MARAGYGSSSQHHSAPSSPLLSSSRRVPAHEWSSLSGSLECPKSYGSTTNPIKSGVDIKLVGHVLEPEDTLQGLAIKYGVAMEDIRRLNKLWANDNLHIYKIIKIPVKSNSEFADLDDIDVNSDGDHSPTAPMPSISKMEEEFERDSDDDVDGCHSNHKVEENANNVEQKPSADHMSSFLSRLDSQILKKSGPEVIQSIERRNPNRSSSDESLFRPLPYGRGRGRSSPDVATSGRFVTRARSKLHYEEEQFFEL